MMAVIVMDLPKEHQQAAREIVGLFYSETVQHEFDERFTASQNPQRGAYVVHYVGAFEGERLIGIGGYAQSSMTDAWWALSWGTVLPEKQGQGVGKKLLEYRLKKIIERSTTSETFAMVSTRPTRLYLDSGFKRIDDTKETETTTLKQILSKKLS